MYHARKEFIGLETLGLIKRSIDAIIVLSVKSLTLVFFIL